MERSADWLDQAEGDIAAATHSMEGGFYDWACCAAQQSAWKALRAVFERKHQRRLGRSILQLLSEIHNFSAIPANLREKAEELDKARIVDMYPSARRQITSIEAARLIGYAAEILSFSRGIVAAN